MDIPGTNHVEFMDETNNNWDLSAVVRIGMTAGGRSSATDSTEPTLNWPLTDSNDTNMSNDTQKRDESSFWYASGHGNDGFGGVFGQQEVTNDRELYGSLCNFPEPNHLLSPPTNFSSSSERFPLLRQLSLQKPHLEHQQAPPSPRTRKGLKKKKSEGILGNNKIYRRVLGENLQSVDKWAWRKYGQKPIKGTPYQRSYYKCSTKKNCTAKKLVERIQTEPDTFIVSYYGEHFHQPPAHRNALAGLTRGSSNINSAKTRIS